jgi:hypothetical protein
MVVTVVTVAPSQGAFFPAAAAMAAEVAQVALAVAAQVRPRVRAGTEALVDLVHLR